MNRLAARLQEEEEQDNMGAGAARAAAEALTAAARAVVESLPGAGSSVLLIGLQQRLCEATVMAWRLSDRQLSAAAIRDKHREADYADGFEAGLTTRRGLHSVS